MPPSLTDIFYQNRGNISDKWEQYLAIYDSELQGWQGKQVSLLEIGVQNGGSMQVWAEYFAPDSDLIGLDIDARILDLKHPGNVSLCVADATVEDDLARALGDRTFDVIIDDGSHHSDHIRASFCHLFSRLNKGGRYVVEDLHCAYWPKLGGGLRSNSSAIEFFKSLIDIVNFDHLTDPESLGLEIDEELLFLLRTGLARISFYDSVAVIERLPFDKVGPFRRVLAGDVGELVEPSELLSSEGAGSLLFTEPLARRLESGVVRRVELIHKLTADIGALEHQLQSLREHITREQSAAESRLANAANQSQLRLDDSKEKQEQLKVSLEYLKAGKEAILQKAQEAEQHFLMQLDSLRHELKTSRTVSSDLTDSVVSLHHEVEAIKRSQTYRLMNPVRKLAARARSWRNTF
jgi:SAM-dependent methyltransferase